MTEQEQEVASYFGNISDVDPDPVRSAFTWVHGPRSTLQIFNQCTPTKALTSAPGSQPNGSTYNYKEPILSDEGPLVTILFTRTVSWNFNIDDILITHISSHPKENIPQKGDNPVCHQTIEDFWMSKSCTFHTGSIIWFVDRTISANLSIISWAD